MRSISDEQRGLLCRVREEARDAIEAARGAIDGHVAEVVHRRQEKEGARASAAADVDLARDRQSFPRDGSSRAGDEPALREAVGDNGQGDEVPDGGEPRFAAFMTEEQAPNSAVEGSCRSKNTNEGDEDGGGDVQDVSGDEDNLRGTDPQENQDQGPHRSRAEEEDDKEDHGGNETTVDVPAQREVLAAIAAAEASCLSRVFPWARDARHRARETAASWNEEVASGCRNERTTTNTELETLALAFRAAKKEADEDVFGSHERDSRPRPPGVAGGHADVRPGEMSGSTNWVPLSGVRAAAAGRQAESVPHCEYRAEEQKESSALWLSFERLLPSLQIDHQRRTGKGGSVEYCYGVEEEEEEGEVNEAYQSALRTIDGLESELKREVAAAFAGKIEEARSMMRAVKEKLRSERGVPERGKEKAEAVRLAQQRARAEDLGDDRAEGAVLHAEDVGTERVPGEDATTAGTADRPRP